jgi:signal transduction histidine kinase
MPTSAPQRADLPADLSTLQLDRALLARQLAWIIRLRWLAGIAVVVGGFAERALFRWYDPPGTGGRNGLWIECAGMAILLVNAVFRGMLRAIETARREGDAWPRTRNRLYILTWSQILIDLIILTALVVWTGGYDSPLRGFFVFHMVFASLLLPRMMAFGVACVTIGMVEGTLLVVDRHTRSPEQIAGSVGRDLTLLATVYLASTITRQLRQQRRELARRNRRIQAMTAQLHQQHAALVQQEKMVTMGQMAAGVAHEVANPLASMDGLLQLMERRPEKLTPENLTRLREQIARISGIVRQLTTLAHPERGASSDAEALAPGSLNDVVTRALELLRFDRRLKGVVVETRLERTLPAIPMHAPALEQVVMNLVINALDAMEGMTDSRLTLETLRVDGRPELRIIDTGTGIPTNLRAKIFEPFFTTKPVGKGTGLGLSISQTVVRRHGGEIVVADTEAGRGTTMRLRFGEVETRGAKQV